MESPWKQLPPAEAAAPIQVQPGRSPEQDLFASPSGGVFAYGRTLRRNKAVLLLSAFLGALAAVMLTLPQTPVYQARTSIEVQGVNQDFLNLRSVNPNTDAGAPDYPEYELQSQVRVLRSRTLLDRVARKLDLENRQLAVPPDRISAWRRVLGLRAPNAVSPADQLTIRPQPNTRFIDISYDSADPRLAADFVNTLARELIEQNLESRWKTTQDTGEWLSRQMEDVKIKLEHSEERLQEYARLSGLQFTSEQNNVAEQTLRQLEEELSKARADRVAKQSKYETASSAAPESLPDVLDDDPLRQSQSALIDLRRQLAALSPSLTAEHPKVKRIQAQIAALESSLGEERGNIVRRIQNDYEAACRRESLLAKDYAAQTRLVTNQADQVANYGILKHEVDTNRQVYDSMLQRVKEVGIAAALRASNIRILDPALPPSAPYKPNLFHNTALGLLGGAISGLVWIALRERADRTLQDPGDAAAYLGLPELGLIPSASADPSRKRGRLRFQAEPENLELVSWQCKPSAMAESFRAAIASIRFTPRGCERPRVIVLSSPSPKEGKTTVAANLAIALAGINCRVLLIDGDFRKPRLHRVFDIGNEHGLASLLRSQEPITGPLNGELRATGIPGLTLLPSGRASLAETALLYSGRLDEVIALARRDYDAVLIDTPPMTAMPDARVIARLADGVILVARARQTSRASIEAASNRFSQDGACVLGMILNDWNPKCSTRYGNYHYYDHYKHYYTQNRA
jgi:capsular exopolysaccharide synthesis family protein